MSNIVPAIFVFLVLNTSAIFFINAKLERLFHDKYPPPKSSDPTNAETKSVALSRTLSSNSIEREKASVNYALASPDPSRKAPSTDTIRVSNHLNTNNLKKYSLSETELFNTQPLKNLRAPADNPLAPIEDIDVVPNEPFQKPEDFPLEEDIDIRNRVSQFDSLFRQRMDKHKQFMKRRSLQVFPKDVIRTINENSDLTEQQPSDANQSPSLRRNSSSSRLDRRGVPIESESVNDQLLKDELDSLEKNKTVKVTLGMMRKLRAANWQKAILQWHPSNSSPFNYPLFYHTAEVFGSALVIIGGQNIKNNVTFMDSASFFTKSPKVTGAKNSPKSLFGHTCNRVGNKFFVFGGVADNQLSNKVYMISVIDDDTIHWSAPRVNGVKKPKERFGHSSCRFGHYLVVFGGFDGINYRNDLWILNTKTLTWHEVILGECRPPLVQSIDGVTAAQEIPKPTTEPAVEGQGPPPAPDLPAAPVVVSAPTEGPPEPPPLAPQVPEAPKPPSLNQPTSSNSNSSIRFSNDPETGNSPQSPPKRMGHTATIVDKKMYIIGGNNHTKCFNVLYYLDLETLGWYQIDNGSTDNHQEKSESEKTNTNNNNELNLISFPQARTNHCASRIGTNILISGGKNMSGNLFKDSWMLYTENGNCIWTEVKQPSNGPPGRFCHTISRVETKLIMLGGNITSNSSNSNSNTSADIWICNTAELPLEVESEDPKLIEYKDIRVEKEIGGGNFSKVYKAIWEHQQVALKRLTLKKDKEMDAQLKEFKSEVFILGLLNHPNVVCMYGYCTTPMSIVMEFLPHNLYSFLHDANKSVDDFLRLSFARGIANGMIYLHSKNIIHRDLKSCNILLDNHLNPKIGDLGIARQKTETSTMTTIGTIAWTAPEILRHEAYNEKVDVYSFAIVLWECLTQQVPFANMDAVNAGIAVATQRLRPTLPEDVEDNWGKFVQWCWLEAPAERPSFVEILNYLNTTF